MSLCMSQNLVRTSPRVLICSGAPEYKYQTMRMFYFPKSNRFKVHYIKSLILKLCRYLCHLLKIIVILLRCPMTKTSNFWTQEHLMVLTRQTLLIRLNFQPGDCESVSVLTVSPAVQCHGAMGRERMIISMEKGRYAAEKVIHGA